MNARKRQVLLRMLELVKKHPSFSKQIGVKTNIKERK